MSSLPGLDEHITGNWGEDDPALEYNRLLEEVLNCLYSKLEELGINDVETYQYIIGDLNVQIEGMKKEVKK